jgi:hypothetical protein
MRRLLSFKPAILVFLSACLADVQSPEHARSPANCVDDGQSPAFNDPPTHREATIEETLFEVVTSEALSADQLDRLARLRSMPTSIEVHVGRLRANAEGLLERDTVVRLDVSPTRWFTARGAPLSQGSAISISWSGSLQNEWGPVALVLTDKDVTGSVNPPPDAYRFEPIGDGLHALVCLDPAKFPPD